MHQTVDEFYRSALAPRWDWRYTGKRFSQDLLAWGIYYLFPFMIPPYPRHLDCSVVFGCCVGLLPSIVYDDFTSAKIRFVTILCWFLHRIRRCAVTSADGVVMAVVWSSCQPVCSSIDLGSAHLTKLATKTDSTWWIAISCQFSCLVCTKPAWMQIYKQTLLLQPF